MNAQIRNNHVSPEWKTTMDRIIKDVVDSYEAKQADRDEAKLQRQHSAWLRRRVDKITVRVNDGSNQCVSAETWLVLGQRLAA